MMKFLRLFAPAALAVSLFLNASAVRADESLLQKESTEKLTKTQRSWFGPKSASLRYDSRMIRAAQIAQERAHPHMTWHCWKYVKDALLAAQVVNSRPTSAWAKDAGVELCQKYGFTKLNINDPYKAPVGAVVVYGGQDAGHVEIRTEHGFVSDFQSNTAYPRPLVGIYVKPS